MAILSWTASALAGHIVTQPIPAKQSAAGAKSTASKATSPSSVASKSAAKPTPSGGLKWKAPRPAESQQADEGNSAKTAVAKSTSETETVKTASVAGAAKSAEVATPAVKTASSATPSSATTAKPAAATAKSVGTANPANAAEPKTQAAKTAAVDVRPIEAHDNGKAPVIQTAVTTPKIDPFGDDPPAAKTSAKPAGTPAKRAAQAGVQPDRERPFPADPSLDQPPAKLPAQERLLEEGLTRAPPRGPEPCPSPKDLKPLNQISNRIEAEPGEFPAECGLGDETFSPRQWSTTTYTWMASGVCHKPLYFEDVQLERYGNSCSPFLQPVISGAHFFLSVPILPYNMGVESPFECIYPLGTYRPGSCAPFYIGPVPISARGALYETGTVLGLVFLIP